MASIAQVRRTRVGALKVCQALFRKVASEAVQADRHLNQMVRKYSTAAAPTNPQIPTFEDLARVTQDYLEVIAEVDDLNTAVQRCETLFSEPI